MALVAMILSSFTYKQENDSFVGTCLCPDCGAVLAVQNVNGKVLK